MKDDLLTAVMPTRNRVHCVVSQLRLFAAANFRYPLVVADSSDAADVIGVWSAVRERAEYRSFAAETPFYDKLANVIAEVKSPFVLLVPDKKITCPHAVDIALEHLQKHQDHVATLGYVLGFGLHRYKIDFNRVVFYTPTIGEEDPLQRHYHLMRRYQVSLWAVFRREALATAIAQAQSVEGAMFQEIMFMNALVLQGKLCRLPVIFGLQGPERSLTPANRADPLYWFLDDSESFFQHYARYRHALAKFIAGLDTVPPTKKANLAQVIDVIHGVWLNSSFDHGILNYTAQRLLGAPLPPLGDRPQPLGWRPVAPQDVVDEGEGTRTYIWRDTVLNAEPKDEIRITAEERECVQRELDAYYAE